ncbi:MAG: Zn-dependent hydrolase, partial [Synechococcus sp. BS301-5m-G53]|nr:Zn-dependent hydrolase [Synechococcus sp. BS301-5m-G53]
MSVLRSAVTAAAGLALGLTSPALAGGGVSISSYGQRSLLIQGGG